MTPGRDYRDELREELNLLERRVDTLESERDKAVGVASALQYAVRAGWAVLGAAFAFFAQWLLAHFGGRP